MPVGASRAHARPVGRLVQRPRGLAHSEPYRLPESSDESDGFNTIKTNIETGVVTTPEDFHEAVLLVFKNAMLYNTKRTTWFTSLLYL